METISGEEREHPNSDADRLNKNFPGGGKGSKAAASGRRANEAKRLNENHLGTVELRGTKKLQRPKRGV